LTSAKYSDDLATKLPPPAAIIPPASDTAAPSAVTSEPESAPTSLAAHSSGKATESVAAQYSSPPPAVSARHAAKLDTALVATPLAAAQRDPTALRTLAVDTGQIGPQPDAMQVTAFTTAAPSPALVP
jgi:hypothetical protein